MPLGQAPEPPPPDGRLVLVVEDEFLIAMDLELLLQRHGWRVLGPAATVAEALRLLRGRDARRGAARRQPARRAGDAGGGGAAGAGRAVRAGERLRPPRAGGGDALAGAPNVGKPTDERRLLAALAQAVAP